MLGDRPSIALQVQLLDSAKKRVLVLAHIASLRSSDRRFAVSDVSLLAADLRLPRFSNISQTLSSLNSEGLAIFEERGRWALTPLGDQTSLGIIADLDVHQVEALMAGNSGALFDSVEHKLVPPEFAPPRWSTGIERLLKRFPFDTNVFCMTRFPSEELEPHDPLFEVVDAVREVLESHGLTLHLASDRQADDDLMGNIGAHMWACKYGIGLLEARNGGTLNYNAVIELGSMIITGRRCAMLKDISAPNLPVDLSGHIYKSVDFDDVNTVRIATQDWVTNDLELAN